LKIFILSYQERKVLLGVLCLVLIGMSVRFLSKNVFSIQIQHTSQVYKCVNINKAGFEELVSLEGIGPVIAQRILEYRKKQGFFKTKEDLLKIKGMGPNKLLKIKNKICID